jgi:diguanylate cyclase (GGDEF)-like protein
VLRFYNRSSIRQKVVLQVTVLVTVALLSNLVAVGFLVRAQVTDSTQALLQNKARVLQEKIEQRLRYLIENTTLLASNQLMVNSLTDSAVRERYMPPLIDNFLKGKDVLALNVVDYAGRAIFQTQHNLPRYNESSKLRRALAYRKTAHRLRENGRHFEVISPIEYYATTQGAVMVVFDLEAVVARNMAEDEVSTVRLLKQEVEVYRHGYHPGLSFATYRYQADDKNSLFAQLGVVLELGVPTSVYNAPLLRAVLTLLGLGLLFILVSAYMARRAGNHIAEPIVELNRRVKAAHDNREVFCSPIGTDDELEDLAKAFDDRTLELQHQAEHDALTDLPNRVLLLDRLQQAIKRNQRSGRKLAVLFIDLDRFKEVNDSFGHDTGDALLQVASDNIGLTLRRSDSIARLGGDEFAVLIDQVKTDERLIGIVEKILGVFREPFILEHRMIYVTCSIGVAICPDNGATAEELLRNADAAMYRAKDEGRNTYQFYTEDMTQRAIERVTLESELREAIRNRVFQLHFQAQMDMRDNRLVGMECLVRWQDERRGMVPPDQFIGLAEETGLIVQIDRWVLEQALEQCQRWHQAGLDPGVISLNLSPVQLSQQDFIGFVQDATARFGVAPAQLMFEVTETAIMRSPEQAIEALEELKRLGFALALDDFGTGLSSLSYLKQLPVDKIKIDRAFVKDIPQDEEDMRLTQAIISMASRLHLQLIAEGVETLEQVEFLIANGCFEAQGYYYHKPSPAREMEALLRPLGGG